MILDDIIQYKKKKIKHIKDKHYSLKRKLKKENLTLIAEIKKASPSKGLIADVFLPEQQLKCYQKGGAEAVSILTEENFFQGSPDIVKQLRPKAKIPILRKDFIIDPLQIYESCLLGADVILLIAAVLKQDIIKKYLKLARRLGLEAIVEVHNQQELLEVIETDCKIIGINNRNLKNFSVDLQTTEKLLTILEQKNIRSQYYVISESGINNHNDIQYLKSLNIDGVLIGETLMRSQQPAEKIKTLLGND